MISRSRILPLTFIYDDMFTDTFGHKWTTVTSVLHRVQVLSLVINSQDFPYVSIAFDSVAAPALRYLSIYLRSMIEDDTLSISRPFLEHMPVLCQAHLRYCQLPTRASFPPITHLTLDKAYPSGYAPWKLLDSLKSLPLLEHLELIDSLLAFGRAPPSWDTGRAHEVTFARLQTLKISQARFDQYADFISRVHFPADALVELQTRLTGTTLPILPPCIFDRTIDTSSTHFSIEWLDSMSFRLLLNRKGETDSEDTTAFCSVASSWPCRLNATFSSSGELSHFRKRVVPLCAQLPLECVTHLSLIMTDAAVEDVMIWKNLLDHTPQLITIMTRLSTYNLRSLFSALALQSNSLSGAHPFLSKLRTVVIGIDRRRGPAPHLPSSRLIELAKSRAQSGINPLTVLIEKGCIAPEPYVAQLRDFLSVVRWAPTPRA
ncbi:hypothetical protein CONPUDRAFT_162081 [Coniophora puteana RWD-64-598 SS2]|uniref:F-box domain-containing protein n=1 Tax=Coniophora puteana (strain RWD-64-598) TaxID=741705 RepID=A0A5M3N033_CONPW|nr:uncharacterized protein CONPUDRAFT_162081 [Coniophora puteana RWD-64-598 SS2]EIW84732.1 hypothetical protein CONPUDRAFT_162081 [Coniophora puteana RWD-64-598 SS2]